MKFQILLVTTLLLITGCGHQPKVEKPKVKKVEKKVKKSYRHTPPPPKKKIKLKEVEDENFSSEYMYPEAKKKKVKTVEKKSEATTSTSDTMAVDTTASTGMSKAECIGMIGQEKFDKYTQMYGGESASLKKCKMLKAL